MKIARVLWITPTRKAVGVRLKRRTYLENDSYFFFYLYI